MGLMSCIAKKAVCADLEATERNEAFTEILESLITAGYIQRSDFDPVMRTLIQREELGTTAIGKGIAVPHGKIENGKKIIVTFGRSSSGINYGCLIVNTPVDRR